MLFAQLGPCGVLCCHVELLWCFSSQSGRLTCFRADCQSRDQSSCPISDLRRGRLHLQLEHGNTLHVVVFLFMHEVSCGNTDLRTHGGVCVAAVDPDRTFHCTRLHHHSLRCRRPRPPPPPPPWSELSSASPTGSPSAAAVKGKQDFLDNGGNELPSVLIPTCAAYHVHYRGGNRGDRRQTTRPRRGRDKSLWIG
uniref:Secreted protein n=1 Tax=Knipowitschia caucasica TaxID=637954 RepID=A0AAV2ML16_KNICA